MGRGYPEDPEPLSDCPLSLPTRLHFQNLNRQRLDIGQARLPELRLPTKLSGADIAVLKPEQRVVVANVQLFALDEQRTET